MTGYGKSTSGLLAWCGGSRGLAWLAGLNLAIGIPLCLLALAGSRLHAAEATVYSWLALPPLFSEWLMRPWTLLTYMAAHFSLLQLLFNTAWLIWFGRMLLDVAPQRMLLQLYIGGGIAGGLCYMAAGTLLGGAGAGLSGASVAVLSLMTATALTMPNLSLIHI